LSYNVYHMLNHDDTQISPPHAVCSHCGSTLLPDSHYCSLCGETVKSIEEPPVTVSVSTPPVIKEPLPEPPDESTPDWEETEVDDPIDETPEPPYTNKLSRLAKMPLILGINMFTATTAFLVVTMSSDELPPQELVLVWTLMGLLPIILGVISLNRIKKSRSSLKGKKFAVAGIILGTLAIIIGYCNYLKLISLIY